MPDELDPEALGSRAARRARAIALLAAMLTALLGLLVLTAGWELGVTRLTELVAGSAAMTANTALAFALTGVALGCLLQERPYWRATGRALAAIAGVLGTATLVQNVTGLDFGIDQLLTFDRATEAYPGRMPPQSAAGFAAASIALLTLRYRAAWPSQAAAVLLAGISLVVLIGYVYQISSLYASGPYGSIAPHTAIGFLLLAAGTISARPGDGIVAQMTADSAGGELSRRFVPAAIVLPLVIGWLRLEGQRLGFYGAPFGVALFALTLSGFFVALTLQLAGRLDRSSQERLAVERDLAQVRREADERAIDLAVIVDASEDAIIGTSTTGVIRSWNGGAERMYGYSAAEALGHSIKIIIPPDMTAQHDHLLTLILAGQAFSQVVTTRQAKDGRLLDVSLTVSPIRDASGVVIGSTGVARDITLLRLEEERFRLAVEAAPAGMLVVNGDGRIVLANRELERMFGYAQPELLGQSIDLLVPDSIRDAHEHMRLAFVDAAQGRRMGKGRDIRGRRRGGEEFPVEIGLNPLKTRDGLMTLSVVMDVSERQALLHRLEQQATELTRSNKELTQFAYVASHDLQEPLRMVASFVDLLKSRYQGKLDDRADEFIGFIKEGTTRMQRLIRDLLAYSRVGAQTVKRTQVDLNAVAARVQHDLAMLARAAEAEVVVHPLPTLPADEVQIGQVLQNLVANAIKFHGDAPPRVVVSATRAGGMWQFTIDDNGIGIDMQHADRVFEVFQRLHERSAYEGTGIGLAIVKRAIEGHGGRVWVESTPGVGSRFHFTLPAAPAPDAVE